MLSSDLYTCSANGRVQVIILVLEDLSEAKCGCSVFPRPLIALPHGLPMKASFFLPLLPVMVVNDLASASSRVAAMTTSM